MKSVPECNTELRARVPSAVVEWCVIVSGCGCYLSDLRKILPFHLSLGALDVWNVVNGTGADSRYRAKMYRGALDTMTWVATIIFPKATGRRRQFH